MPLRDVSSDPATIAKLRRRRVSFEEIATHLGITQAQAAELYRQAIESIPEFRADELRAEELLLADDAMRRLMTIAIDGDATPRTRVEAWNSVRGWAEHKARLAGLDKEQIRPDNKNNWLHELRQARPGA